MNGHILFSASHPSPEPPRRRGMIRKTARGVRWLFGGASDWAGIGPIRRGASWIGSLLQPARPAQSERDRVYVNEDRTLDLTATAFSYGLSEAGLRRRLEERRRQTARIAYGTFILASLFLLGWLRAAWNTPMSLSRLMLAVDYLPFCALFFLLAFYNALLNFQIRAGRRATWREYLLTEHGFLPR